MVNLFTILADDHYISDRDAAINNIEMEEENIKKLIDETRSKINAHLDDLEERFLTELSTKFMKCNSEYSKSLINGCNFTSTE
jgi:hypothetical protein